jgi:hypothetical protein
LGAVVRLPESDNADVKESADTIPVKATAKSAALAGLRAHFFRAYGMG